MSDQQEYIGDDWLDEQQPERVRVIIVDQAMAQLIRRDYCCAGCWGHLNLYHVPDSRQVRVRCDNCGDGRGFVTKRFVDRRRSDNLGEAVEVRQMLRGVGVVQYTQRSVQEVLADLGFWEDKCQ